MNPMLIIAAIQAAIQAAPQVEKVAKDAKDWVSDLVNGGVISAAQQDQIHSWVDATAAAIKAGTTPPEFTVEADPAS